ACNLQSCLSKYTYEPQKCDRRLRKLYECCQRMYDSKNEMGTESTSLESTACPMEIVVKRWLKDNPGRGKI
ncbi:hypothetical protein J132_01463, partial [Termitomyces sp. J132]